MTLFEYLSVAVSIVLSLSAAQLLTNIRAVFRAPERYWVHSVWVIHLLIVHIQFWWGFWSYRDVETWNLVSFSFVLINPGLLFVCSNALVKRESRDDMSWEEHFFAVRKSFFVLRGVIAAIALVRASLLLGRPIMEAGGVVALVIIIVCSWGAVSTNKRVHGALALIGLAQIILGVGYVRFFPGIFMTGGLE